MFKLENNLISTDPRHSDMIDALAFMIASREAKLLDSYFLLYVKTRPKWMPKFFYNWCIKTLINVTQFKK